MMDRRHLIAHAGALVLSACDKPAPSPSRLSRAVFWDEGARAFRHRDGALSLVRMWDFAAGDEGFSATQADLHHRPGLGLEAASRSNDPQLRSPGDLGVRGAAAPLVLVRLRRIIITGPWDGALYYSTSRHGESADYMGLPLAPPRPTPEVWSILVYDMRRPTHGGGDWRRSEISQIRLDLDAAPGGLTLISHIALARLG
ncbi:MAG: hypothetical protein U1A07_21345 [Phenylobacterium sp.]|nr:hypothetical protein [Phenylobacterium sp.]